MHSILYFEGQFYLYEWISSDLNFIRIVNLQYFMHVQQIFKSNTAYVIGYHLPSGEIDSGDDPSPSHLNSPRTDKVSELESFLNHSLVIQTTSQAFNNRTGAGTASFFVIYTSICEGLQQKCSSR
jgi:hypothetical protein